MKTQPSRALPTFLACFLFCAPTSPLRSEARANSVEEQGSLYLLTTPEGANLPASVTLTDFPVLIRLSRETFPFAQAQPHGEDLRITDSSGTPLTYQIEQWDAQAGQASVWVRVPKIVGNARQELRLHWGDSMAKSASSGPAVFNVSNGYLSVWHMDEALADATGMLTATNKGTTLAPGPIGAARRFAENQGVAGGEKLTGFPTGNQPHSSQAWFRAERPNVRILGWGNEERQGKVTMLFRSPPHISMDCYFSDAGVASKSKQKLGEWLHVVHTYEKGNARVYVNGVLDGVAQSQGAPLNIQNPAHFWIGGWYNNYDFVGEMDEVRVSSVTRSADWVRLEYENQKPLQTLVGTLIQPGSEFSVSSSQLTVREGERATITAKAGGAQKLLWLLDGNSVATDQLSYTLEAGRVRGDQKHTLLLKAIYPDGVKTREIPVTIQEAIADPVITLKAPRQWDGRSPIEVTTNTAGKSTLPLHYTWKVEGLATSKDVLPGKLRLTRAQNSGTLTVSVAVDNGGAPVTQSVKLAVTEPKADPWVERKPAVDEQPTDNQFYTRSAIKNEGTLHYNGVLSQAADAVFLRLYADGALVKTITQKLGASRAYAFSVLLKPGLIRYEVAFGSVVCGQETVLRTVKNLVCGDAFLVQGQSNAVATDFGKETPAYQSEWIRTFGTRWEDARYRNQDAQTGAIGYWGMELAKRLVESEKVPVCILNGAVGGTRIDQHQRNANNPTDPETIYGRLLARVQKAGFTHGIRGILWHQGENDQGADGPTGGFGWETYREYFIELTAAWKLDFPNVQRYYVFQIWPKSCAMGIDGSDNQLRDVQRQLPALFSKMSIMSTLGIDPPGGCHFPAAGYAEFARLIFPVIQRDSYGKRFDSPITPPSLKRVTFASAKKDTLVLEFDQPMVWESVLTSEFYLDGQRGKIASGVVSGNRLTLTLTEPTTAQAITYLDSAVWSQKRLLRGANGIAALTFCHVPLP
ncbi:DUF2341 domain-containing protein [Armatimonas sp.]|uniref:DUF2341 domain-containing protein n=1 Tax=Armatimonas sp. TaxID=1872638 RepID=UPI00286CC82F|nr:DUF2341 domain-containing protein [Armatimonas sp.]